jgi:hypothetical protein
MTKYNVWLLDVNALIAIVRMDHIHHRPMQRWFDAVPHRRWSSCPITQSGFVRIMVATGAFDSVEARHRLEAGLLQPGYEFWPADIAYAEAVRGLVEPKGHKQVTDAYLLGLALHRGGMLATFDKALKTYFEEGVELIPT